MKKSNNENRSFFLYTALIFIMAILMVMLAFLGQNNLHKNQQSTTTGNTIQQNTAKVVEDNANLHEEIGSLNKTITEMDSQIAQKDTTIYNNDLLISAYLLAEDGKIEESTTKLNQVNKDILTDDFLIIYEKTTQRIGANN